MLTLTPINLKTANAFVQQYHRHHKPTRGHKFSIGVSENGDGVEKDLEEAKKWYQKAADQGYEDAKEALERINGAS